MLPSVSPRDPLPMKFSRFPLLAAAVLVCLPARAQPMNNGGMMEIEVRSGIDMDELYRRWREHDYAANPAKHATIFLIATVMPHPSIGPLVKMVDAPKIAQELTKQLEKRGFHAVLPDQKPEIIITVEYGRGWLPNPYTDSDAGKVHNNLSNADPFHPWPVHEIFFSIGEEMMRQRADEEKLIIQVRAWKFPPPADPKKEPTMLWMTSMSVDDPEHRDLNEIYQKMLAAGAPHFDKPLDRDHPVRINSDVPEGHVKIGRPEVIDDFKSK